jgi:cation diffusion facilitator CzcD-associated flavoprotein CzcO
MQLGPARDGSEGIAAGFDADALRARYREEREKRLRSDGNAQYLELAGAFAHLADDPWVEPGPAREPLADEVDVALIGGGIGGLLTGARLRQRDVLGLRIVEKGGDVGGTWYWNRYPGIACDIESYVYLPLLEEIGYLPREHYSRGAEILEHCRAIARHFDLYRDACLQTRVEEIRWDEDASRWIVSTDRGDAMRARFVCLASGFLEKPKLPGIPGIESFAGHAFHTSRWDYAYTGGDAEGGLSGLRGRRVGIIGTGASAVQCVPHLAASAEHLFVFQRTPSSVDVRGNRPTDPAWARSLEPGWQRRRIEAFHVLTTGGTPDGEPVDLVRDGWTDVTRVLLPRIVAGMADLSPQALAQALQQADLLKMEEIRARVDSVVNDPATAEALKPYYPRFCKRPCFHDEYLEAFNRPNVTLVDTQGRGVERITPKGVVVDGREIELDCLIYATGFATGFDATATARRVGYEVVGRDGLTLSEKWCDGVRTLHGLHIHGFPNCYMMGLAQSALSPNYPYLIDLQATHIAYVIGQALGRGLRSLEVSAQAEAEWVATILRRTEGKPIFAEGCTPGYYNNEGRQDARSRQGTFFMGGPTEFAQILAEWRAEGGLAGLVAHGGPRQ